MLFDTADTDIGLEDFLRQYWQREPLLIRQAFPGFVPPLDADDLAGLACEELADSRLVRGSYPAHDWALRHGPFSEHDFSQLPDSNWTLLVQDVEKHYPPLRSLMDEFAFLPRWRIDDLMVSVAAPGGSVGPHCDRYDVFLLQAAGRRRWQIASHFDPELLPDCELNVLQRFEAEKEWVLEAGDVLYLPPGVAHHGIALDAAADETLCMTWSIGMRAPSQADLLQGLGEWLAVYQNEGRRYRDGALTGRCRPGEIDAAAVRRFRSLLSEAIADESALPRFLGAFLSRYRLAHEPAAPPAVMAAPELAERLRGGAVLRHNPWTRLLWLPDGDEAALFAAGEEFRCPVAVAEALCRDPVPALSGGPDDAAAIALAHRLLERGHLVLETGPAGEFDV